MTSQQITLDFPSASNYGRSQFMIGACNAIAADWIDRWPDWPGVIRALIIHGEPTCGKTHLATIWKDASHATNINSISDGIDALDPDKSYVLDNLVCGANWPDEMLFHLLTRFTGSNGSLLILAKEPPAAMPWRLADVASRLAAINTAHITAPDDDMLEHLMRKLSDDRGMALDGEMISYIVKRMERSFVSANAIIDALDEASITQKKKVNMGMARKVLADMQPTLF
jgi:chromosomal replication initiation ATPase DnaA